MVKSLYALSLCMFLLSLISMHTLAIKVPGALPLDPILTYLSRARSFKISHHEPHLNDAFGILMPLEILKMTTAFFLPGDRTPAKGGTY